MDRRFTCECQDRKSGSMTIEHLVAPSEVDARRMAEARGKVVVKVLGETEVPIPAPPRPAPTPAPPTPSPQSTPARRVVPPYFVLDLLAALMLFAGLVLLLAGDSINAVVGGAACVVGASIFGIGAPLARELRLISESSRQR